MKWCLYINHSEVCCFSLTVWVISHTARLASGITAALRWEVKCPRHGYWCLDVLQSLVHMPLFSVCFCSASPASPCTSCGTLQSRSNKGLGACSQCRTSQRSLILAWMHFSRWVCKWLHMHFSLTYQWHLQVFCETHNKQFNPQTWHKLHFFLLTVCPLTS